MSKMMDIYNAIRSEEDVFTYHYDNESIDIHIRKYISPGDKMSIANEVYNLCHNYDDSGNLIVRYGLINPIKRVFFVNVYCKDFTINLGEDGDACFDFIMNTDFFDKLVEAVGNDEFYEYSCCIDDYIDFCLDEHRAVISSSKLDNALSDFLKKVNALVPDDVDSAEYANLIKKLVNMPDDKSIVKEILEFHGDSNGGQDKNTD